MRINRLSNDSIIETYFDTMSRYAEKKARTNSSLVKTASAKSGFVEGLLEGSVKVWDDIFDSTKALGPEAAEVARAAKVAEQVASQSGRVLKHLDEFKKLPEGFRLFFGAADTAALRGHQTRRMKKMLEGWDALVVAGKNTSDHGDDFLAIMKANLHPSHQDQAEAVFKALRSGEGLDAITPVARVVEDTTKVGPEAGKAVEEVTEGMSELDRARRAAEVAAAQAHNADDVIRNAGKIRGALDDIQVAAEAFGNSCRTGCDAKEIARIYEALGKIEPASFRRNVRKSLIHLFQAGEGSKVNIAKINQFTTQLNTLNLSGAKITTGPGSEFNIIMNNFATNHANVNQIIGSYRGVVTKFENQAAGVTKAINRNAMQGGQASISMGNAGHTVGDLHYHVWPPGDTGFGRGMQGAFQQQQQQQALFIENAAGMVGDWNKAGRITADQADEMRQMIKNVGNVHIDMTDMLKEFAKLAGKGGAKGTKSWLKWILGTVAVVGAGAVAYHLWDGKDDDGGGATPRDGGEDEDDGGEGRERDPIVDGILDCAKSGTCDDLQSRLKELEEREDKSGLNRALNALKGYYRKNYIIKLDPSFTDDAGQEVLYAFVNRVRGGSDPGDPFVQSSARDGLADTDGGGGVYNVKVIESRGDSQVAINETVQAIIGYGLSETGIFARPGPGQKRSRRYAEGKSLSDKPGRGMAGQRKKRMTKDVRRRRRAARKGKAASERFELLQKIAEEVSNSTNNNTIYDDSGFLKGADDVSKSYYKDAVTDLNNNDKYLRSYFTGLKGLYDEKAETPKGDYKSLYNVHDETGVDLVNSAHPKAVVVLDSIGRGGLVENGLEQQRQTQGVAFSTPTGNYRANYAWVRDSLNKTSK